MIKSLSSFLLIMLVFLSIYSCDKNKGTDSSDISTEQAYEIIKNSKSENVVLIDVRKSEVFQSGGYIRNAINVDFFSGNFVGEIGELDKKMKYIVYCQKGRFSEKAVKMMKNLGFSDVRSMIGGIIKWRFMGMPVVK